MVSSWGLPLQSTQLLPPKRKKKRGGEREGLNIHDPCSLAHWKLCHTNLMLLVKEKGIWFVKLLHPFHSKLKILDETLVYVCVCVCPCHTSGMQSTHVRTCTRRFIEAVGWPERNCTSDLTDASSSIKLNTQHQWSSTTHLHALFDSQLWLS